jgi:hypothetical protein
MALGRRWAVQTWAEEIALFCADGSETEHGHEKTTERRPTLSARGRLRFPWCGSRTLQMFCGPLRRGEKHRTCAGGLLECCLAAPWRHLPLEGLCPRSPLVLTLPTPSCPT